MNYLEYLLYTSDLQVENSQSLFNATPVICSRPNCTEKVRNKQKRLCESHYRKQLRADRSARKVTTELCLGRLQSYRVQRWTYKQIADACGLPATVIRDVITGRYTTVTVRTHQSIMTLPPTPSKSCVTPKGFRRRIEALACMSWGQEGVANEIGYTYRFVNHAYCTGKFSVKLGNALAEAYPRLASSVGPNAQAGKWAKAKGWAPPAAWDDDTIDTAPELRKGIFLNDKRGDKTHCKRGHELVAENLLQRKGHGKTCRTCHNMNVRAWRKRQSAA